jgi:chromosomal replication initiation ATPase DnaA
MNIVISTLNRIFPQVYGLTFDQINRKCSKKSIVRTRQAYCYFLKEFSSLTLEEIGHIFTNFNDGKGQAHTNVRHSIITHKNEIKIYPDLQRKHKELVYNLGKSTVYSQSK